MYMGKENSMAIELLIDMCFQKLGVPAQNF